jgi:hypothetical protein
MTRILTLVAAVLTSMLLSAALHAQQFRYTFGALAYTWPSSQGAADSTLTNDGAGQLTWEAGVPTGMLALSTSTCPTGWSEYLPARGRYLLGLPAGGTNVATVGSELTNTENRPAGIHDHPGSSITVAINGDTGHSHGGVPTEPNSGQGHRHGNAVLASGSGGDPGAVNFLYRFFGVNSNTGTATTGVTFDASTSGIALQTTTPTTTLSNPSGSIAATNAPYIQYRVCERL